MSLRTTLERLGTGDGGQKGIILLIMKAST